jgi:hypothetical protein
VKLEGTLDAFGLPDVLQLLGFTAKTGALRLSHGSASAEILVREGLLTGLDAEGLARLLLWDEGDFAFDAEAAVPSSGGISHAELIDAAQSVVASWRSAAAALPEDSTALVLTRSISAPVTIEVGQWALLSRIDGRRTVGDLCASIPARVELAGLLKHGLIEPVRRAAAFVAPAARVDLTTPTSPTAFTTSVSVASSSTASSGSYETVGSLAMKPDILLAPVSQPGIHDILLKRLVVSIRGL